MCCAPLMNRHLFVIIIFLILLYSCNGRYRHSENPFSRYNLENIVSGISKTNVVMGGAVGIAGARPEQWDRYLALCHKATDTEIINLTNHTNAVVRCYAFDCMLQRKNLDFFNTLLLHLIDTAEVHTLYGCLGGREMVGDYFLQASKGVGLNKNQESKIDSILLFDKRASLNARVDLLDSLRPEEKYYQRIREMVRVESFYQATPLLAKYRNKMDIFSIANLLRSQHRDKQLYGLRSVIYFPDSSFFPALEEIVSNERQNESLELYSALVQYKSRESRNILERELQKVKGMELARRTDLIYQALKRYPDSVYLGVIKLDFFD